MDAEKIPPVRHKPVVTLVGMGKGIRQPSPKGTLMDIVIAIAIHHFLYMLLHRPWMLL